MLTLSYFLMVVSFVASAILFEVMNINIFWLAGICLGFYIIQLVKNYKELFERVSNDL